MAQSTTLSRTDLGPLTTTFEPPSDCTSNTLWFDLDEGWKGYYGNSLTCWTPPYTTTVKKQGLVQESCFPGRQGAYLNRWTTSSSTSPTSSATQTITLHFFSPAIACPAGYTAACAVNHQTDLSVPPAGSSGIWSLLTAGETAIGCCPSGYTCGSEARGCYSSATKGQVLSGLNLACRPGTTSTRSDSTSVVKTATEVAEADMIRIIQGGGGSESGGLSTGAYVGIGVGVGVVVLILIGACVFCLFKHKKKKRTAAAAAAAATTEAKTQQYQYQYQPQQQYQQQYQPQQQYQQPVQQPYQQPVQQSQANSYGAQGNSYQTYNGQWSRSTGSYGAPQDQQAYQTQQTSPSPGWASAEAMPRSPDGSELEARPIPVPELPTHQNGTSTDSSGAK